MKKRILYLFYVSLFILSGFLYSCKGDEPKVSGVLEEELEQPDMLEKEQEETEETVFIYVCGSVADPGVYELQVGARAISAIEAAGGMTEAAAVSYVNLAEQLTDGQKLYIPTEEEAEEMPAERAEGVGNSGLVNINTAAKEELMQLSGIGESKAGSIIAWREQQGSFEKIEDIRNVDGIGESTFQKLKDFICV